MAHVRRSTPDSGLGFQVETRTASKFSPLCFEAGCRVAVLQVTEVLLSDTTYLLIRFRKSTPPQKRQIDILIRNSKQ